MRLNTMRAVAALIAATTVASLAACATGSPSTETIRLGWTGAVPPLDPAASSTAGSYALLSQIYPSLMTVPSGGDQPVPEIAATAEWTAEGVYTVVLKSGLAFANGDQLTTSDVKFSIERQLALQAVDGSWRQLDNLASVEIVDATTVEFHVQSTVDSGFPYVLAGPAGLILDEEVFFADELTPDADILEAQPFAGSFALTTLRGDALVLEPYSGFAGTRPATATVEVHPGEQAALAAELHDGTIDAITGRLDPATVETLVDDEASMLSRAASGRVRMLAFDFDFMPFGLRTEEANVRRALAVRTAVSEILDRGALTDPLGANWVEPLTGYLPDGITGAADVFTELHGDGFGGPDLEAATSTLAAQEVETPVALRIHVDLDQVGEPGSAEVAAIAEQLDASGLFTVEVVETDAGGIENARLAGETQAVFTSLLPVGADPGEYLAPFRSGGILSPGFTDADVDELYGVQLTAADPELRSAALLDLQTAIAARLPAIPITQGVRLVFARSTIMGIELDDSQTLDFTRLRR